MERLAALDPGSRYCAVAVGTIARTIDVDPADLAPAVAAIEALLVANGATRLLIEWSRFYGSPLPGRTMAKAEQYAVMRDLVRAVAARCRALGITVATDEQIRKVRGRAWRTGLVARSTWCRWIGAEAVIDAETGKPRGVTDASVKAALEKHFAARPDLMAELRDTHRRDAAGLFLGWVLAAEERAAAEVLEREREAIAAAKASEIQRNRKPRKRTYSPEKLAYKAKVARLWYEKRGRAKRGWKRRDPLQARLTRLLADGPKSYTEIARALGKRPDGFHVNFSRAVAGSGGAIVQLPPERVPGQRGRPAGRYALATPET